MRTLDPDTVGRRIGAAPASNPRVVAAGNLALPSVLVDALDRHVAEFRLFVLNAPEGMPDRDGVTLETPFVGAGMRDRARLAYYPARLSLVPALLRHDAPPDVVLLHVAPPRDGLLSLGVEVNILPAAIEIARARGGLVVAQINRQMPYTFGDALVPVDHVDLAIEHDEPIAPLPLPVIGEVHSAIGGHVAALVADGATLQTGIGAVPNATLAQLTGHRGLRVWSEMVSDGIMALGRAGALSDDLVTTSFAAGSPAFYDWLDGNRSVVFLRTERVNDPAVIARQRSMTSINAALQVDLFDQANASYAHGRIYSGFGGQTDFMVGALHAHGGRAIIALPSWHERSRTSTIVEELLTPATSFQHSHVVTEHGIATIWGRPQRQQARELIEHAAAPPARDQLRAAAQRLFG